MAARRRDIMRIGPFDYTITRPVVVDDDGSLGSTDYRTTAMAIKAGMSSEATRATEWHESFHQKFWQAGMEEAAKNEPLIEECVHHVMQMLRDNPWMREV